MKKIFILAVILALVISCSFGVVASAAEYSKIDISDYVSGREFVGNDVIVSYDLPLDPWTEMYGFATGSNTPSLIDSYRGNFFFFQDSIDGIFADFDLYYWYTLYGIYGPNSYASQYQQHFEMHILYDDIDWLYLTYFNDNGNRVREYALIEWDSQYVYGENTLSGYAVTREGHQVDFRFNDAYQDAEFEWDLYFGEYIELGFCEQYVYEEVALYQRVNGNIYPLGKTNGSTNMIQVSDIKPGAGFTLSFDLLYEVWHDSETELDGNIATFDAVWLDKNYQVLSLSQYEIDYAPYEDYQEFNFDIDFTVPSGASYFYLRLNTGYFYVNTAREFAWDIYNITMTTTLSSIEENSQTMQKVQQKLDKIDDQLGDIQDSIGDTNDKLDDIIDHVPEPIPPEGSDVIEDTDDIEHDLIDDAIGNLDQLEDVKLSAIEAILLYAGGFACVSTIIDLFARLPFFTGLLYVSLSLGIVSSLLSIANTISSRSGKSHAGKE